MSCKHCGTNLKFNDNSITKIKDKDGFAEIYPIGYCPNCNKYFSDEGDGSGLSNELTARYVNKYGYDKWF